MINNELISRYCYPTITSGVNHMKRTMSWIAAAGFLLAAGNLKAVEVEVPGLLTDHTVSSVGHNFYFAHETA